MCIIVARGLHVVNIFHLYFRDKSRYCYKHAVLDEKESMFMGQKIERDRRVSVIMRNEPNSDIARS